MQTRITQGGVLTVAFRDERRKPYLMYRSANNEERVDAYHLLQCARLLVLDFHLQPVVSNTTLFVLVASC